MQSQYIMEDLTVLKIKPNNHATFNIDELLAVPPNIRSVYTGVRFKEPPYAIFASANTTTLLPPVAIQRNDAREVTQKEFRNKTRTVFTGNQISELEKAFDEFKYLTKKETGVLANSNGMTQRQVTIWLQNRRQRWRSKVANEEVLQEKEKMRNRSMLRNDGPSLSLNRMNRIITPSGLQLEELSEGQKSPVVFFDEKDNL